MKIQLAPLTAETSIIVSPDLEQRAIRLLDKLKRSSAAYAEFSQEMNARLASGEPMNQVICLEVAEHPLTELVRAQRPDFMPFNRSDIRGELEAARIAYSADRSRQGSRFFQPSVAPSTSLQERLCAIAATIGVASKFRASGVMAIGNPDTGNVVFPPPRFIGPQLSLLEDWRRVWVSENPLLGAVLSMTLLKRIHPFPDSNGRSIRSFFSVEFSELIGAFAYLPWTLAAQINPICWHLRMREAQSTFKFDGYVSHALQVIESVLDSAIALKAR